MWGTIAGKYKIHLVFSRWSLVFSEEKIKRETSCKLRDIKKVARYKDGCKVQGASYKFI